MKIAIVAIGNSRGVRLPKAVLEQVGFGAEANLEVEDGRVVLTPTSSARSGWAEAFAASPAPEIDEESADWLEADLDDGW